MRNPTRLLVLGSTAVWAIIGVASLGCAPTWQPTAASSPSRMTSVFDHPWVWLDEHGERVVFSQWRGKPLVVTAIYTSCDDTCPRTVARLREVEDQLARDHREAVVVVVTLDPRTDTPEQLRAYKASRHLPASWHLLTGDRRSTDELAAFLKIHLMDMESHVVHDATITLFDAAGMSDAALDVL